MSLKLSIRTIVRRYAKAFFNVARARDLAKVEEDLLNLKTIFINHFSESQIKLLSKLAPKVQESIIIGLIQRENFHEAIYNLCITLIKNKRISLLVNIIDDFFVLLKEARGGMNAEIVSASMLSEQEINDIKSSLDTMYKKDIGIDLRIDKEILGGLIITINSFRFDNSIRTKFRELEKITKNSINQVLI